MEQQPGFCEALNVLHLLALFFLLDLSPSVFCIIRFTRALIFAQFSYVLHVFLLLQVNVSKC